jgi:hypothetical protein
MIGARGTAGLSSRAKHCSPKPRGVLGRKRPRLSARLNSINVTISNRSDQVIVTLRLLGSGSAALRLSHLAEAKPGDAAKNDGEQDGSAEGKYQRNALPHGDLHFEQHLAELGCAWIWHSSSWFFV